MVIPLLVIFFLSCQATIAQLRDDSGVLNLFEVSSIVNGVCEKELNIHLLLSKPFLSNIIKQILRFPIPFLPGPEKFKPLYFLEWLEDHLGSLEDQLSAFLEGKDFVMEESYVQHPNHTHVEIGDLLLSADFLCKSTHLWYDIVSTKLSDLLGLWHIRLPIPDFHHKFQLKKALDFLDLLGIPDRLHRLFSGHLGLSTTTTTTHQPTFLESIFNQGVKTTTPKPKKPGFFESLFGHHTTAPPPTTTTTTKPGFFASLFGSHTTTTSTTPAPTTTTKPGFFASLFGGHPASSGSATTIKPSSLTTTKHPGGFLASLFGNTPPTTVSSHKPTTKKPGGLLSSLFGGKTTEDSSTSSNNSETDIEDEIIMDYNYTTSMTEESVNETSVNETSSITIPGGLLPGPHSTSTIVPASDETLQSDDQTNDQTSKKPSGLFHRRPHSTSTIVPESDETIQQTSEKPSGLFHRKPHSTTAIAPESDETIQQTSEKPSGLFHRRPHSTTAIAPETDETIQQTSKKPSGLFHRRPHSTTAIAPETDETIQQTSKKPSGLFHRRPHSTSTNVPESDENIQSDEPTGEKPSELFHRRPHSTTTIVQESDETIQQTSEKPSELFHRRPHSTTTIVPESDETFLQSEEQTSEKTSGLLNSFRRKHQTDAASYESTISTNSVSSKKPGRFHLFGSKSHSETVTSSLNPEFGNKDDDKNIPNEIADSSLVGKSTPLLSTFDSREILHQIIEEIGSMEKRTL
uniref:Uncharacterized protein n=1 Tax=Strigamia maritima TaxID=126957 RepID=T1J007_STRMM